MNNRLKEDGDDEIIIKKLDSELNQKKVEIQSTYDIVFKESQLNNGNVKISNQSLRKVMNHLREYKIFLNSVLSKEIEYDKMVIENTKLKKKILDLNSKLDDTIENESTIEKFSDHKKQEKSKDNYSKFGIKEHNSFEDNYPSIKIINEKKVKNLKSINRCDKNTNNFTVYGKYSDKAPNPSKSGMMYSEINKKPEVELNYQHLVDGNKLKSVNKHGKNDTNYSICGSFNDKDVPGPTPIDNSQFALFNGKPKKNSYKPIGKCTEEKCDKTTFSSYN